MKSFNALHLFIFLLVSSPSLATDMLDELLKERKILYKNFEYYQSQKNSFWGTQSKKDLKGVIEVLKKIIVKDSEIIKQINIRHSQRNVQFITKSQVNQDFASELEYENNKLKLLLNKTTFDYNQLLSQTEEMHSSHKINNTIIFVLILSIGFLFFYVVKLKKSLRAQNDNFIVNSMQNTAMSTLKN